MSDRPMRLGNVLVSLLDVAAIFTASIIDWDRILAPVLGVDDPLDVPFFLWGLGYFVGTLVFLALVRASAMLVRRTSAGRNILDVPLHNRAWFWLGGAEDPRFSFRFFVVLGAILLVAFSVAGSLLASRGILPGPGRTADTLVWALVATAAAVLAIVVSGRILRRQTVDASKDAEDPSAS